MSGSDEITVDVVGVDAWVAPHGELDLTTIADFRLALTNAAACSQRYVFVDLASVTFIDAANIGAIVRTATELNTQGRRLKVLGACGHVQYILDITGISAFYGVKTSPLDQPRTTRLPRRCRSRRRVDPGEPRRGRPGRR